MSRDLRDYVLARQGELTDFLAGCAVADTPLVVELLHQLRPADLTSEPAKRFLLSLKPDTDPRALALAMGLVKEYPRWMLIATDNLLDLRTAASGAVNEIKSLCITRQCLTDLGSWLREAQRIGRYVEETYDRIR